MTAASRAADTVAANRARPAHHEDGELWLFGYGSLIFKADFPYRERRPAAISGWVRRFWQGSHDHRGTPDAPGRVVTLVESPGAHCRGMAYRIGHGQLGHLDLREKNGYLRCTVALAFDDGTSAPGLVYIATADNPAWLGPAPAPQMAGQIRAAAGPSGANREYLLDLARALRALGAEDEHVFALERLLAGPGS